MTENRRASRLYIVADNIAEGETITSWVEVRLTDHFLDRLLKLHSLVSQYQLEGVIAAVDGTWHLESNWTVESSAFSAGCTMHVSDLGFTIECMATADTELAQREHHSIFRAIYIWGYVSELVDDWRPSTDFPRTCFEKLGGWESHSEEETFRNMVMNGP